MKETHYKLKHRVTALFAAAVMLCSMLPGAAFAEEPTPQPTEETVQMEQQTEPSETDNGQTDASSPDPGEDVTEATSETAEEQPAEEEISAAVVGAELYTDLPDAPIGSYIGSEGLPVATGETKIGISEWPESQLEEGGSYLTAVALDNDGLTMAAPLLDGADYAIVPIMAQVEYPANGSTLDLVLPDGVTLLDYYGAPAEDAESLLHNEYSETSAAVLGVYVQADADFTAQLVYTAPDGSTLTVPANSDNEYLMRNAEWSLQVNIRKTDSETGNPIAADACYEIYQWDSVSNKFLVAGGYNTYSVQRQGDGSYAVINALSDFVFSAIKAIGAILLGFGIVQIGLALKSHDAGQRAQGFMTFFGGVIIYFAKDILDMIL